jgi:hypothetical protein
VFDYSWGVPGIPLRREAGWFVTGPDRDPVRHLFVRVTEHMDGSGRWSVELHECRGQARKVMRTYDTGSEARTALDLICRLARHLAPLSTWDSERIEPGRWRMLGGEPAEQDPRQQKRTGAGITARSRQV